MKPLNVVFRIRACFFRKTLGNHRASAALSIGDANLVAGRFKQLGRRLPNIGIVVVEKSVVEQNDFAGNFGIRISEFGFAGVEPGLECMLSEYGKLAAGVNSDETVERGFYEAVV